MTKKKCSHCGYNFKPKEETETLCELCKIQLRDNSSVHSFEVKYLRPGLLDIQGILLLSSEKIVFEPNEVYFKDKKLELRLSRIKDVRFATEKDISALRVWLVGPVLGTFLKKKHNILLIDFLDKFGIEQHLVFEGSDMDLAISELDELRKAQKLL